ncbi:MAG: hypothetical protein ABI878_03035 [Acidobacteriota bacterium]
MRRSSFMSNAGTDHLSEAIRIIIGLTSHLFTDAKQNFQKLRAPVHISSVAIVGLWSPQVNLRTLR